MIYRDLFVNCNKCFSGQYDGLRKPMPEYHVKVAGFDERVGFYLIFFCPDQCYKGLKTS